MNFKYYQEWILSSISSETKAVILRSTSTNWIGAFRENLNCTPRFTLNGTWRPEFSKKAQYNYIAVFQNWTSASRDKNSGKNLEEKNQRPKYEPSSSRTKVERPLEVTALYRKTIRRRPLRQPRTALKKCFQSQAISRTEIIGKLNFEAFPEFWLKLSLIVTLKVMIVHRNSNFDVFHTRLNEKETEEFYKGIKRQIYGSASRRLATCIR